MNDTITGDIRQLRCDAGNATECEDETVEVDTAVLERVLAEYDRLAIEAEGLREDLLADRGSRRDS